MGEFPFDDLDCNIERISQSEMSFVDFNVGDVVRQKCTGSSAAACCDPSSACSNSGSCAVENYTCVADGCGAIIEDAAGNSCEREDCVFTDGECAVSYTHLTLPTILLV